MGPLQNHWFCGERINERSDKRYLQRKYLSWTKFILTSAAVKISSKQLALYWNFGYRELDGSFLTGCFFVLLQYGSIWNAAVNILMLPAEYCEVGGLRPTAACGRKREGCRCAAVKSCSYLQYVSNFWVPQTGDWLRHYPIPAQTQFYPHNLICYMLLTATQLSASCGGWSEVI